MGLRPTLYVEVGIRQEYDWVVQRQRVRLGLRGLGIELLSRPVRPTDFGRVFVLRDEAQERAIFGDGSRLEDMLIRVAADRPFAMGRE